MSPRDAALPRAAEDAQRLERALARLDGLINWERKGRGRMRVTLEPARDLCARLGDPQLGTPAVHVTGSKGKGSVCALVAAGLTAAGRRTGRYSSPHVERVTERIAIDGREVAPAALAQGIELALAAREAALIEGTPARDATWFDLLTGAAWCALRASEVEWLVVECGLGGRFDSTNTLDGEVCVITNVELEHTNVLGTTRAAIAAEKAGILSRGCTLVTGVASDDEAGAVIDAAARELGVRVLRPAWLGAGPRPSIAARNREMAGLVLDELGRRGHSERGGRPLGAGLLSDELAAAARLPGRLEWLWLGATRVLLDGAHTPGSVADVLADLTNGSAGSPAPSRLPVAVLGMNCDKDMTGILKSLGGRVDRVLCTSVGGALARTPEEIAEAARALGMTAETAGNPRMALERARDLTAGGGWILVLGSLYLAGAIRPLVSTEPPPAATC
jgi:dihydrofolate synthase / folylpolyglutamate synthase